MGSLSRGLLCTVCGLMVLALPNICSAQAGIAPAAQNSSVEKEQSAEIAGAATAGVGEATTLAELPDSPSWSRAQAQDTSAQQNGSTQSADQTKSSPPAQENTKANQKLQRPVGTAAAEAPKVSGITAAQPAGIAIAPAKQHRVRTIAIKVGAIIGASAALGTVIALTAATPSKPPGAH
jgi:hypothetical protein